MKFIIFILLGNLFIANAAVFIDSSYNDIGKRENNIEQVVNFFLGEYTIAEHYVSGRQVAELLYYYGDTLLRYNWWKKNKLLLSVGVGLGAVLGNEIYEYYYYEMDSLDYPSLFDDLRKNKDTSTDIKLAVVNLILFVSEIIFPPLKGLICIETRSPILIGYLNPFTSSGFREEVIFSSKYLSFGPVQIGITLGHGEQLTEEQKKWRCVPTPFYRAFGPRKIGIEYVPGGPPMFGSYIGFGLQYDKVLKKIPGTLIIVIFTSEQRQFAFRIGVNISFKY